MFKKVFLSIILFIMTFLCSCSVNVSKYDQLAKQAWKSIDPVGDPEDIYYMQYEKTSYLIEEETPEMIKDKIPQYGICILITGPDYLTGFTGLNAVFFDNEGKYKPFRCSFDEYYNGYENVTGSEYDANTWKKRTAYLKVCTYLSSISVMIRSSEDFPQKAEDIEKNRWYHFSKQQIKSIIQ